MRIIVASDNHGLTEPLMQIRERHPEAQAFIHCGDSELPPQMLDGFVSVMGNNDRRYDYPLTLIVSVDNVRILVLHGSGFSHAGRLQQLTKLAQENHCQIVCYGHTHVFSVHENEGVTLINPGSLWHNRDGRKPGYALVEVLQGKVHCQHMEL